MMRRMICMIMLLLLAACSLPPERKVTRDSLNRLFLYQRFVISESPEQIIDALNQYGEVVISAKRRVPGRDIPVHLKLLATSKGVTLVDYDR